ncbi:MAG: hypothetical protein KGL12_10565, partial [Rhodospirillales bacterium]|nr:hypothetical protein [Rhodospirillales bacterium]
DTLAMVPMGLGAGVGEFLRPKPPEMAPAHGHGAHGGAHGHDAHGHGHEAHGDDDHGHGDGHHPAGAHHGREDR